MLQDAGVSPTEVENNLVGVAEETDEKQQHRTPSLFEEDLRSVAATVRKEVKVITRGRDGMSRMRGLFEDEENEECSSIILQQNQEEEEEEEEDLDGEPSEFMSSSDSLSLSSSGTTVLTKPDLSRQTSGALQTSDKTPACTPSLPPKTTATEVAAFPVSSTPRNPTSSISRITRPFSPTQSDTSAASCSVNARQQRPQQQTQPRHQQTQQPLLQQDADDSKEGSSFHSSEVKAQAQSPGKSQDIRGPSSSSGSQSPIPSFIVDSFTAGTLGMKTLREKWTFASGVLSWNKPKSEPQSSSCSSSVVTSPSGLFIRRDGIVNEKKPALVETSILPPLQDDLLLLSEKRDGRENKDQDLWTTLVPPPSRKHLRGSTLQARPMSDVGFLGYQPRYPAMTMARDIPRPPINRIHDYLQRPDSYNPSPLHFRAISMAANLIDTGAITPAKLYARRTQTMIANWTLGLIMNTKPSRSPPSSFPTIRESPLAEQEDIIAHQHLLDSIDVGIENHQHGHLHPHQPGNAAATATVPNDDRRSGTLSPPEPLKAWSFKNRSSAPSLASSSYPHSSSLSSYQPHHLASTRSVVELSDISSPPLSMSPTFSYLGDVVVGKPLTDRYGFLVNARPMAVQQGLLKLNESNAYDDFDLPSANRANPASGTESNTNGRNDTYEYLSTPVDDFGRPSSPPPQVCSLYFGHGPAGSVGSFVAGTATTSTTAPSTSLSSPILSTSTRPTSTLSPPSSSAATVTTLLSQIKVLHDSVQTTQKEKWDAFLRKRRRRVHAGETNGGGALSTMSGSNIGTPMLFSNLMFSLDEQQQQEHDDEDIMYWTSVCLVGIATIGKGSEWEEFRDLARGGIPVMYRNKIWQEASGALDMRQPGYYKELLSRQDPEACQCWGDIEMDLHRTFPTNVLFGPGGQGIEKLKNILLAYSLHNPSVGYCQGMNLLAGTLLLTNNSEEEAFWILTSMLGRHLPEDYFTQQLLSPQADQRVLKELVQEIMPRLSLHFQEMHVDLTAVTFSWFLTLFTDCLPVETLLRIWDVFFVEGMIIVFKVAVAILWMNEKEILKCKNGAAVYCFMKQMTLSMHQTDKLIKVAFVTLKSYIHPEKVEAKRQKHQKSVRQELIQEQQLLKVKSFACDVPPAADKKLLQN
ncbi:hypothetical protein BGZ99_010501 [Dissophora globulifera]|uniref:Rab-GAP TBC domain-containing protein n=1 Tax=Dissophora globulifera TaxID=979702 RepID=A0A9P6R632_9FUNG|nr:hypothetical protein BGZ99_010501 [Dissophora globulifera]